MRLRGKIVPLAKRCLTSSLCARLLGIAITALPRSRRPSGRPRWRRSWQSDQVLVVDGPFHTIIRIALIQAEAVAAATAWPNSSSFSCFAVTAGLYRRPCICVQPRSRRMSLCSRHLGFDPLAARCPAPQRRHVGLNVRSKELSASKRGRNAIHSLTLTHQDCCERASTSLLLHEHHDVRDLPARFAIATCPLGVEWLDRAMTWAPGVSPLGQQMSGFLGRSKRSEGLSAASLIRQLKNLKQSMRWQTYGTLIKALFILISRVQSLFTVFVTWCRVIITPARIRHHAV
jgi:hypothetical protein